ncbi:hypothetical protein BGP77_12255 [Saccharospirillum sp. MSK14-1]|uniref:PadR family transcriptional regulator n=1 Tax=Saccharospirillum sp. MSK14-1 TaxID=1897632 RepID=UPI000D34368C|nr:PadR family transcriptional regulator [Saccharospirillum sp. MSK14-1]PTY38474.1 hypothetical protein BGP77_12255 [Saccharospirillum sp. MSK14-1]
MVSPTTNPTTDGGYLAAGMPATRKLSATDLRLLILVLLSEQESYGTELADRIERLTAGFYRPSPGMMYPRLAELVEQGAVELLREGRRKHHRISDRGRALLAEHSEAAERVRWRLESTGRKYRKLRASISQAVDSDESGLPLAYEQLAARQDLKAALRECLDLDAAGQREVTQILQETTARIRALRHD